MKNRTLSRTAKLAIGALAAGAIVVPASAMATQGKPKVTQSKKQLPASLRSFASPLPQEKTDALIETAKSKYGPGKTALPRFKKSTTKAQRSKAIKAIDRTLKQAKADPKVSSSIKDAVSVWEAMNGAQKNDVLANSDAIVAVWPAGVAATAAAVMAGVAVADLAYKVYVDQRDNGGDDDDDEEETDTGDGGDTGAIKGALSY